MTTILDTSTCNVIGTHHTCPKGTDFTTTKSCKLDDLSTGNITLCIANADNPLRCCLGTDHNCNKFKPGSSKCAHFFSNRGVRDSYTDEYVAENPNSDLYYSHFNQFPYHQTYDHPYRRSYEIPYYNSIRPYYNSRRHWTNPHYRSHRSPYNNYRW
jgi:hypothetical protein